jgi:hypothetical protein
MRPVNPPLCHSVSKLVRRRRTCETGIMQAVPGGATVVTGGDKHAFGVGAVLVIPCGMPDQFVAVTGPFLYVVAKVRA